jgi:hypothetical protein
VLVLEEDWLWGEDGDELLFSLRFEKFVTGPENAQTKGIRVMGRGQ